MLDTVLDHARAQRAAYLQTLNAFLRIPSISTLPEAAPDMERAATWLADFMRQIGLQQVEIAPTGGYPVVYGEWLGAGPTAPTLLVYGHYDVQPVDPLEKWESPPFEPTVRGEHLYCRGVSDDKGQLFMVLAAVASYLRTLGRLPIHIKIMAEGEEEISSPHLAAWVRQERQRLACDAVLICDSAMFDAHTPLISYGTRGLAYMEVTVKGPANDLHSGTFGGLVDNPFNVLVRILAQLQDGATRRVRIPGFYDRVRPPDEAERALLQRIPLDANTIRQLTGVPAPAGEEGFTWLERGTLRPTLDIHGIIGGFTGPGSKTVIPAEATAKVSMRLVPDQDPAAIARLFTDYVHSLAPATVTVAVRTLNLARPGVVDVRAPAIRAAAEALSLGFGVEPLYLREGGTLPIIPDFQEALGATVVLMGFGLRDDNIHAPNERFYLPNFDRGLETLIHYFDRLAHSQP
jgi:acetylornithine deacetylase/succinyl-diaminopimelate desuccinylase-like protein